jgi:hypothetical protein
VRPSTTGGAQCLAASLLLAACNQTGTAPLGEPLDQLAGFAGTPVMQPGQDCTICHRDGRVASDRQWTISGTVFSSPTSCKAQLIDAGTGCSGGVEGAQVLVTMDGGATLTLTTNSAGNFYTDEPIAELTSLMIQKGNRRMVMNLPAAGGLGAHGNIGCNYCHTDANPGAPTFGRQGAPGSLFIPGE